MKVILRQDISTLGAMGDIVNVKNGYARNYLIPRELAYVATPGAMKALEFEKKKYEKRMALEKAGAENIAQKLTEMQVSISMKSGEEGRLFGSVTGQMIADKLAESGIEIDRRSIIIDEPIKSLGIFDVKLKLHTDVHSTLKVWVISEDDNSDAPMPTEETPEAEEAAPEAVTEEVVEAEAATESVTEEVVEEEAAPEEEKSEEA
jgi:large subunit ribosomal protein L9